ncbi:MAG: hypothetical protein K8R76_03555 [Candidatus Aegiribacteria sp.]|nr:hypothetical protein [Candidatus Aegiribacteria sp.]
MLIYMFRRIKIKSILFGLSALLVFFGCGGPDWEYFTREYFTVLPFDILAVFDQNVYENELSAMPYVHSGDGFYLIESPAHLDSVFEYIDYWYDWVPRLDTLFPEDGYLVMLDYFYPCGTQLLDYSYNFNMDSLKITIELREDLEYPHMKCTDCWFAIGVTSQ